MKTAQTNTLMGDRVDNALTFGQWLKRRRRGMGLTQRALGERLGYASDTIRKVESDELRPSRQLVERLAQALEVEPGEWARLVRFARDEPETNPRLLPTQTVQLPAHAGPPPAPPRHNLPAPLTSFIGREKEIGEIRELLHTRRLVTLTGAGGMGKSRLSIEVARGLVDSFGRGVWLVELASLAAPVLVPQALAEVLGVRETPGQPLTGALSDYVRDKPLLLVLDNCEHLIEACAALAQTLLQASQSLHILATSREALRVPGEHLYTVSALALPATRQGTAVDELLEYAAVRLFVDRAATALPGFTLDSANVAAVAQVCRRLEGMPLALELAAARVNVLRVEQIASRLSDSLSLLAGGSRTGLARHQTLRATIDWSYALLSEAEQALLRRASVFVGGWTLELAEAICADEANPSPETLELLAGLARKSMLVVEREPGRAARYRLLETIRAYGHERLRAADKAEDSHSRHLKVLVQLAEEAEPHLRQADQGLWLARLREELDNVRAALSWSLEQGRELVWGARLAAATWRFWSLYGYLAEGMRWLELALAAQQPMLTDGTPETLALRGRLLTRAACLSMWSGNSTRAAALANEGLLVCREFGAKDDLALALIMKGNTTSIMGDIARGEQYLEETIRLARAENLKWFEASAHFFLCCMARNRNDYDAVERHGQICLTMCRELGEQLGVADTLGELGGAALARERYAEAAGLFAEGVAANRVLRVHGSLVFALIDRGEAAQYIGEFSTARGCFEEALALAQEQGAPAAISDVLFVLGNLARREGNYEQAEAALQQSLATAGRLVSSPKRHVAYLHRSLAAVARCRGDWPRALAEGGASLRLLQEITHDQRGFIMTLREMALLWAELGRAAEAPRLFAAVETNAARLAMPLLPVDRSEYERGLALVRAALDEAAFAAAWGEGQVMTLEAAATYALEVMTTVWDAPGLKAKLNAQATIG